MHGLPNFRDSTGWEYASFPLTPIRLRPPDAEASGGQVAGELLLRPFSRLSRSDRVEPLVKLAPEVTAVSPDVSVREVPREVAERTLADARKADDRSVALLVLAVAAVGLVGRLTDVDAFGVWGEAGIARSKPRDSRNRGIERDDVNEVGHLNGGVDADASVWDLELGDLLRVSLSQETAAL